MSTNISPPESEPEISWRELIFGQSNTLWFLVVAIGFLAFELTAQPALVAVAVCSKFGISDFLNGLWLRRRDPLRARGKICFWFCLSQGLWKTTIVAFVAIVLFIVLSNLLVAQVAGPPAGFIGTAMTFVISFVTASLTTWIGVLLARTAGIVVWIDAQLTASRRSDVFPPKHGHSNRMHWLLAGSLILPIVIFLIVTLLVARAGPNAIANAIGLLIGLLALPIGILVVGIGVAKIVVAESWVVCWTAESKRRGLSLRDVAIDAGVIEPDEPDSGS